MMEPAETDVIVVGAGAAGMAAARELVDAGLSVVVLEARSRIGGRIWTVQDPASELPIELGAEFVHGRPAEIFEIIRSATLPCFEYDGETFCSEHGDLRKCEQLEDKFDEVFKRIPKDGGDMPFLEFLNRQSLTPELREHVLAYVEGFDAAQPEIVSAQSIRREREAAEKIEGERMFRIVSGYCALIDAIAKRLERQIVLNAAVSTIRWRSGDVECECEGGKYRARQVIVTVPLALLKSRAIRFEPAVSSKESAVAKLAVGPVVRLTLLFRERFWDNIHVDGETLGRVSFLFGDHPIFPTWWTPMPNRTPMLTGWSAGPRMEPLRGRGDEYVLEHAMGALAHMLHVSSAEISQQLIAHFHHDWQADRWSRGAYSYATVGGTNAAYELALPLEGTLYFAGEATDYEGRAGTVHGAIASGIRAANEVLQSRR